MSRRRSLAIGFLSGLLLAVARPPIGIRPTELALEPAAGGAWIPALALLGVGIAVSRGARRASDLMPAVLLVGAALGVLAHLLVFDALMSPTRTLGFLATLLPLAALAALVARPPRRQEPTEAERASHPNLLETGSLAVAALGVVLALIDVARRTSAHGLGTPDDARLLLLSGFLVAAAGARLARWVADRDRGPVLTAASLAAVPVLVAWQARPSAPTSVTGGFERMLLQAGIAAPRGGFLYDLLLGVTSLGGPALIAGVALSGARRPRRLGAIAFGSALAVLVEARAGHLLEPAARGLVQVLLVGSGAVAAILAAPPLRSAARRTALGASAVACALALLLQPNPFAPADPLRLSGIDPAPAGELEVRVDASGGLVLLDGPRTLTPPTALLDVDRACLAVSLLALEELALRPEGRATRVLLIGWPTRERCRLLDLAGDIDLDHTLLDVPTVERIAAAGRFPDGPGLRIGPEEARRRIRRGEYDLILSMPILGALLHRSEPHAADEVGPAGAFSLDRWDLPSDSAGIGWIPGSASVAALRTGTRILLAAGEESECAFGVLHGRAARRMNERTTLLDSFEVGRPSLLPDWGRLACEPAPRAERLRTRFLGRLAPDALERARALGGLALARLESEPRHRPFGHPIEASYPR